MTALKKINYKKRLLAALLFCSSSPLFAERTESASIVNSRDLDEVIVTATLTEVNLKNVPMTVSTVNAATIENSKENQLLPLVATHTPSLFLTQRGIVGFGLSAGSSGGLTIRGVGGSPTTGMLVLIDGNPQYMGIMGHHLPDAYETASTEKVEVVRGPASILYGSNAMGGVMNIITKKQKEDGATTHARMSYGSYNTFQSQFSNGYKKGRFNSFASFSNNQTDGHRPNSAFKQYTGSLRLGYDVSNNWRVSGESNVTGFWSSNPGTTTLPMLNNDAKAVRGVASAAIHNTYSHSSGAIKGFYNFGEHNINDGYRDSTKTTIAVTEDNRSNYMPRQDRFRSNDHMGGISAYQSYSFFSGNTTTAGIDYKHYGGVAKNRYFDGRPDVVSADTTVNEVAGYLNIQQRVARIVTLNAGLRYDHNSNIDKGQWVPQGGVSVAAAENTTLKAVIGKGFRYPAIRELYMWGTRNPDLKPEEMVNYELSIIQSFLGRQLTFELSGFYIDGKNMIQVTYNDAFGRALNMNTGEFKNSGVEFTGNYNVNRYLNLNLIYSYLQLKAPILAAPKHNLTASAHYSRAGWTAYTSLQYINGLYTALATENSPAQTVSYPMWNVMAAYRFNKYLEGFVKGENLLNQTYEINAGFPMPGATVMAGVSVKM